MLHGKVLIVTWLETDHFDKVVGKANNLIILVIIMHKKSRMHLNIKDIFLGIKII